MTARISIDGNLVADPDYGVGDSGKSWAHLRVASHERMRRDGEWVSTDPEFYNVTLFGAAAETAANTLHKGDRVTVQGRPQLEVFDRRDGSTGASIKVYARTAVPVDTTGDRDTAESGGRPGDGAGGGSADPSHPGHHVGGGCGAGCHGVAEDPEGQRVPVGVGDHELEPAEGHGRAHPHRAAQ